MGKQENLENRDFIRKFRRAKPREGELAATHHRGGTASGLGSYTENISHVFTLSLTVEVELRFFCTRHGRNWPKLAQWNPTFFSKFRVIKQNSEGILMMLWVVVSSEVVHLLLWDGDPRLQTHRLGKKRKVY